VNLSDIRVIMAIMLVLMEESLSQVVMGWISELECSFIRCAWAHAVTSFYARH
jgi:hypothetical protein